MGDVLPFNMLELWPKHAIPPPLEDSTCRAWHGLLGSTVWRDDTDAT